MILRSDERDPAPLELALQRVWCECREGSTQDGGDRACQDAGVGKAQLLDQRSLQDAPGSKGHTASLAGDDSCREDSKGCMATETPAHLSRSAVPHPVLRLAVLQMRWRWQVDTP